MQTNEISIWDCLHDGTLLGVTSDPLSRAATLVIDVPYLWTHHNLPADTRFYVALHACRSTQVLTHQPWPGATEPSRDLPWRESFKLRQENYAKGCFYSTDWAAFISRLQASDGYEISDANLINKDNEAFLSLDIWHGETHDYVQLRLEAGRVSFALSTNGEISQQDFLSLGESYWKAFSERSAKLSPQQPSPAEPPETH